MFILRQRWRRKSIVIGTSGVVADDVRSCRRRVRDVVTDRRVSRQQRGSRSGIGWRRRRYHLETVRYVIAGGSAVVFETIFGIDSLRKRIHHFTITLFCVSVTNSTTAARSVRDNQFASMCMTIVAIRYLYCKMNDHNVLFIAVVITSIVCKTVHYGQKLVCNVQEMPPFLELCWQC